MKKQRIEDSSTPSFSPASAFAGHVVNNLSIFGKKENDGPSLSPLPSKSLSLPTHYGQPANTFTYEAPMAYRKKSEIQFTPSSTANYNLSRSRVPAVNYDLNLAPDELKAENGSQSSMDPSPMTKMNRDETDLIFDVQELCSPSPTRADMDEDDGLLSSSSQSSEIESVPDRRSHPPVVVNLSDSDSDDEVLTTSSVPTPSGDPRLAIPNGQLFPSSSHQLPSIPSWQAPRVLPPSIGPHKMPQNSTGSQRAKAQSPAPIPGSLEAIRAGLGYSSGYSNGPNRPKSVDHSTQGNTEDASSLALRGVLEGLQMGQLSEEAELQPGMMTVPLMKHQRLALAWMLRRELSHPAGGILADDQGLGKTVTTISLILKAGEFHLPKREPGTTPAAHVTVDLVPRESSVIQPSPSTAQNGGRARGGTLIVCPTSVLRQWANEIRSKIRPEVGVRTLIYHGASRTKNIAELASYDIVLTTYSIVGMEVPKEKLENARGDARKASDYGLAPPVEGKGKKKSSRLPGGGRDAALPAGSGPLARVSWDRVVLDEAQCIKNRATQVARASWSLRAKRRWCLSGTPIQNSIDDLFSYFRFLRWHPFDEYRHFRVQIKDSISKNPDFGYSKLNHILKAVMLRRTKATKIEGKPIVNLPPRVVTLLKAEFTTEERSFYSFLETASLEKFKTYAMAGTVERNYVNILVMLLQLRQACDHPNLVKLPSTPDSCAGPGRSREEKDALCGLCNDLPDDPAATSCGHLFCQQCITDHLSVSDSKQGQCPVCHKRLVLTSTASRAAQLEQALFEGGSTAQNPFTGGRRLRVSSKTRALVDCLLGLPSMAVSVRNGRIVERVGRDLVGPKEESGGGGEWKEEGLQYVQTKEKAIVFSQWTSMLNLLEGPLSDAGIVFRRLDGSMTIQDRDDSVNDFSTKPEVTVILMSLKAASLGLNLVSACHVILLDVWWNPSTEEQAIDRAHRIGQSQTVRVSRFTIKDTIEDRILELQEKKRDMITAAFGDGGSSSNQRLSADDLRFLFQLS